MEKHLFLIGMQGCGKSSLGKRTAKETGVPFADTDAVVAQSAGGTVNDFFEQYGEEAFRRAETNVLAALTRAKPMIISTGGGTVMNPVNRHIMRTWGTIVLIDRPLEDILADIKRTGGRRCGTEGWQRWSGFTGNGSRCTANSRTLP